MLEQTGEPAAIVEPPLTTGMIGPDGQVLTRRRLRELRGQDPVAGMAEAAETPAAAAPSTTAEAPAVVAAPVIVAPVAVPPVVPAPETPVSLFAPPSTPPVDTEDAPPKQEWTAPQGHWTRQLEAVDEEDILEATFSREVGSANPTTSALIIQEAPAGMDLGGPLDSTGEILLTGSIPLSPSLSTTGSVERLRDSDADLDDLFDDRRFQSTAQDAQPVRASAVASQHALGTPIVSDGKTRGTRGLTILLIVASALAVVVTGLVVAAIALKWI